MSEIRFTDDTPSFRAMIEALEVGETFTRGARFDPDVSTKDAPIEATRAMRSATQPTVYRIEMRTGNKYTIECGEFRTQSRDIIAVLAVTRTK